MKIRSARGRVVAYVLLWLPLAVLYALILAASRSLSFGSALVSGMVVMGAAAILSLGVWKLSGRFPLPEEGRWRFVAAQLLLALAYTVLWFGVTWGWLQLRSGPEVADRVLRSAGLWYAFQGLSLYAASAAVSYAIRSQRALREQQLASARAQLAAVRAQLRPHFLFNALHSVGALIHDDPAGAERSLERLGDLLRYALDEGGEGLVYLNDEWAFTRNYIDLERVRLGERLHCDFALDDEALDCLVPSFLLQPLVENAIRHGIAPRPQGGSLRIRARRAGDRLEVEVSDDGPGADPARVADAEGVGLRALRSQLRAWYDGRSRLEVVSGRGTGFAVHMQLPAETRRGDAGR